MRISEALVLVGLVAGGALAGAADARAQAEQGKDARAAAGPLGVLSAPLPGVAAPVPLAPFSSVQEALRSGVRDYNAGDKLRAVRALEYAAGQGHLTAQWKLGRMYSVGDGVPHDDLKAFEYFSKIADENADQTPGTVDGKIVATAFVALGQYFRTGIKGSYVKPSPARAHEMFHYAATFFRDPDAQFEMGRLHLDGVGAAKDPRQAARWFKLAAEKGHAPSQATLGDMLIRGDGVPRQVAEGLMWLTLAKEQADPASEAWVSDLYGRGIAAAAPSDRDAAAAYLQRYVERRR